MTKSTVKNNDELERIINSPDFDEEAFEREYFPEGSLEEAYEKGLVEYCNGDGVWRKMKPPPKVTMKIPTAIRLRAESLDDYLSIGYQNVIKTAMLLGMKELEKTAFASK